VADHPLNFPTHQSNAGVDLLALEMHEARSAKAALCAASEVYRQMKQRVPPLIIHVPWILL
jgi:hypothetical protein